MFIGLLTSVVFAFVYATAAARSRRAAAVLLPILDILQSVPVLGFLSVTVTAFIALFPHSVLGLECASIFAIFTAMAWNMAFAFYQRGTVAAMCAITGLTETQIAELIARLQAAGVDDSPGGGRPRCMGLHKAVTVVLVYLRRNLAQAAIAELFGISQPTVSRTIAALEGPIEDALAEHVPTLEDLPEQLVLVFDGTLAPCWSYKDHPELFSGKHHTTGHNHQVASSTAGTILWISEPLAGSTHDKAAWDHHHISDQSTSIKSLPTKATRAPE